MMIAIPTEDNIPHELFDALKEHMKGEPRILKAWYSMMLLPKDDKKEACCPCFLR